jgi:hypothetical protein
VSGHCPSRPIISIQYPPFFEITNRFQRFCLVVQAKTFSGLEAQLDWHLIINDCCAHAKETIILITGIKILIILLVIDNVQTIIPEVRSLQFYSTTTEQNE